MARGTGATIDIKDHLATLPELKEGDEADIDTDDGGRGDFSSYGDQEEPDVLPDRERDESGRFKAKTVVDVDDEEDVHNLRVGDAEEEEPAPAAEKPAPVSTTDETPAEVPPETETPAEEAPTPDKLWSDLQARIGGLPEAEQARILLQLGYIDEATAKPYIDAVQPTPEQKASAEAAKELAAFYEAYEPVGAIEQQLHPILKDIVSMPGRIKANEDQFTSLTTELNEVLVAQRDALDIANIQNAANNSFIAHMAEMMQWELPKLDMKAAVEALRKGKTLDSVIEEQYKPTIEKNKAREAQSRKVRADTPHETANGHLQIEKSDGMSEIARKIRGLG